MKEFKQKVAVITGGASGIGYATAQALAREGARLVLADVEEAPLERATLQLLEQGAEVIGVRTDVGDKAQVDALAERTWSTYGRADIVFNNAGIAISGATQDATHAEWEWSMRVNLWGPIHGVEAFVPRMVAQKQGGHVLFTASFAGLVPNRNLGPYCVTKFGVVALAECLHKDLREHGIGVSVLAPMRVTTRIDQSKRNRPAELGGPSDEALFSKEELAQMQGHDMPAEAVADLVLAAVRRGDVHIHTHAAAREFVRRRWERMDATFEHAR